MVKSELPPCVDRWSNDKLGEWKDKFQDLSPMLKENYFQNVYGSQSMFIASLVRRLSLKGKKVISIGSGSGAEEVLFIENGTNAVFCIEPDEKCALKLKSLQLEGIVVHNCWKEDFSSSLKFDCIYTSSPSDWMYFYGVEDGIPITYLDFVKDYASCQCFLVFRTYGARYSETILKSKNLDFKKIGDLISNQLKEIGFELLEIWWDVAQPHGALIIASNFTTELPDDYGMLGVAYRHQRMIQPNLGYKK